MIYVGDVVVGVVGVVLWMVLEKIGHRDPALEGIRDQLGDAVQFAEMVGAPYWVFVEEGRVVGRVMVGEEPMRLFAPVGTRFAMVRVIDWGHSESVLHEFGQVATELAWEQDVGYILVGVPPDQTLLMQQFSESGFVEFVTHLHMVRDLTEPWNEMQDLRFEKVRREEFGEYLLLLDRALEDSQDASLETFFHTLQGELRSRTQDELDHPMLDIVYHMSLFFTAFAGDVPVGIAEIKPQGGEVGLVGVFPEYRGKGYGRQILRFTLTKLKEEGVKQAFLLVSVRNQVAVHLYESEGFQGKGQGQMFIWRKPTT